MLNPIDNDITAFWCVHVYILQCKPPSQAQLPLSPRRTWGWAAATIRRPHYLCTCLFWEKTRMVMKWCGLQLGQLIINSHEPLTADCEMARLMSVSQIRFHLRQLALERRRAQQFGRRIPQCQHEHGRSRSPGWTTISPKRFRRRGRPAAGQESQHRVGQQWRVRCKLFKYLLKESAAAWLPPRQPTQRRFVERRRPGAWKTLAGSLPRTERSAQRPQRIESQRFVFLVQGFVSLQFQYRIQFR